MNEEIRRINPAQTKLIDRKSEELDYFWVYTLLIKYMPPQQAALKVNRMISSSRRPLRLLSFDSFQKRLRKHDIGLHAEITRIWKQTPNLVDITVDELTSIPGIGYKTAAFFIHNNRECND